MGLSECTALVMVPNTLYLQREANLTPFRLQAASW